MVALNVIVGLRLKRFDQHPPGALARDFIQRQKLLTGFHRSLLLDYLQHRWRPPSTRLPPRFALLTQKGTPPFACRLDPQLLVIARIVVRQSSTTVTQHEARDRTRDEVRSARSAPQFGL